MTHSRSTTEATDPPGAPCPVCDAAAQRGQLVCLECGSRITLGYRRPPSWKVPVAITVAVLMLGGAGGALAYQAIGDEAEREVAKTPANPREDPDPAAKEAGGPGTNAKIDTAPDETATEDDTSTEDKQRSEGSGNSGADDEVKLGDDDPAAPDADGSGGPASDTGGLEKRGELYAWPPDLRAFTVVLLSAEDRPSATSFARSAGESGRDKVGVIRSNDFETLPKGFFVVFAGEYPDRRRADLAAARLGGRFPGAFAQVVR